MIWKGPSACATGVSPNLLHHRGRSGPHVSWTRFDCHAGTADLFGLPEGFVASWSKTNLFSHQIADEAFKHQTELERSKH